MNILAIDYGTKNIGLALADAELRIPYPLRSVENNEQTVEVIKQVVDEHEVSKIIIGLPIHTYGNEGESAKVARALGEKLKVLNVPIIFEDERFTSAMVKKMMGDSKKYDKDAVEAAVILESYLAKDKK